LRFDDTTYFGLTSSMAPLSSMRRVKKACVSSWTIPSWRSTQPSRVTLKLKVKSPMTFHRRRRRCVARSRATEEARERPAEWRRRTRSGPGLCTACQPPHGASTVSAGSGRDAGTLRCLRRHSTRATSHRDDEAQRDHAHPMGRAGGLDDARQGEGGAPALPDLQRRGPAVRSHAEGELGRRARRQDVLPSATLPAGSLGDAEATLASLGAFAPWR
jgi:hypothetical protein